MRECSLGPVLGQACVEVVRVGVQWLTSRGRGVIALALVIVAVGLQPRVAEAQRFELTPVIGWASEIRLDEDGYGIRGLQSTRFDEGSSFGLIGDFALGRRWMLEVAVARRESALRTHTRFAPGLSSSRTDIDTYEVGGQYRWRREVLSPFVGLNVGQTRFDVDDFFRSGSETYPTAALLAGFVVEGHRRIGLRADARYSTVFLDDDQESAICLVSLCRTDLDDTTTEQVELRIGVVFRFGGLS